MNKGVTWSILRYLISLIVVAILGIGIFIWWAVGGSLPKRSFLPIESLNNTPLQTEPLPPYLKIASYNIGHGQGIKERAWDYRDKESTLRQLTLLADAMVEMNAHVFLLQEVDLDSHRTFGINQLEFIKDKIKYPYHACAIVWEKNYLPFPFWPPTHHLGFVRAANCIVSRFPLSNQERIVFDKPASYPFWYNWGYIDRAIQRVDMDVGPYKLALLNVHLEAWESEARELQIEITANYLKEINLPLILGGDFNTIPPDAEKRSNFADDPSADYAKDKTFLWFFKNVKGLKIPTLTVTDDSPFEKYTFPSDHPDRRLDHIFLLGKSLSFIDFKVYYEASTASDHLPVIATIKYK